MDSLLSCLNSDVKVVKKQLEGKFVYFGNPEDKVLSSVFVSDSLHAIYVSTGSFDLGDSISIFGEAFPIAYCYDPFSMEVYKLSFMGSKYLCFLGKAVAASGSGVQVTFYTLCRIAGKEVVEVDFFSSRFGGIDNLGDLNNDGELDYLKTVNGSKMNTYVTDLFSIKDAPIAGFHIELKYLGNDRFELVGADESIGGRVKNCLPQ